MVLLPASQSEPDFESRPSTAVGAPAVAFHEKLEEDVEEVLARRIASREGEREQPAHVIIATRIHAEGIRRAEQFTANFWDTKRTLSSQQQEAWDRAHPDPRGHLGSPSHLKVDGSPTYRPLSVQGRVLAPSAIGTRVATDLLPMPKQDVPPAPGPEFTSMGYSLALAPRPLRKRRGGGTVNSLGIPWPAPPAPLATVPGHPGGSGSGLRSVSVPSALPQSRSSGMLLERPSLTRGQSRGQSRAQSRGQSRGSLVRTASSGSLIASLDGVYSEKADLDQAAHEIDVLISSAHKYRALGQRAKTPKSLRPILASSESLPKLVKARSSSRLPLTSESAGDLLAIVRPRSATTEAESPTATHAAAPAQSADSLDAGDGGAVDDGDSAIETSIPQADRLTPAQAAALESKRRPGLIASLSPPRSPPSTFERPGVVNARIPYTSILRRAPTIRRQPTNEGTLWRPDSRVTNGLLQQNEVLCAPVTTTSHNIAGGATLGTNPRSTANRSLILLRFARVVCLPLSQLPSNRQIEHILSFDEADHRGPAGDRRDARMNPLWTPSPAQRSNAPGVRCIAKPRQEEPDPEPGLRSSRAIYARLTR